MNAKIREQSPRKRFGHEIANFGWVGPINFLVGYGSFLFFLNLFDGFDYRLALVASHLVGSSVAFVLYRKFVFRARGKLFLDFFRFQSTYLITFILNVIILLLLVDLMLWPVELAQFCALIVVSGATFLSHKYFSFFRKSRGTEKTIDSASTN